MIDVPAFKPHLRAVPIPEEGVLLLTEQGGRVVRGAAAARVAALIDGERSADEIVETVSGVLDPARAWSALMRLEAGGHLVEGRRAGDPAVAAFWWSLGLDPSAAAAALAAARVRLHGPSRCLVERLGVALRSFGVAAEASGPTLPDAAPERTESSAGGVVLDVVLTDDYLSDALPAFDDAARAGGRRWLLARPAGTEVWLGPLFAGAATGCLRCLRRRMRHLRPAHRLAAHHDPARGTSVPLGVTPGTAEAACRMVATEVAKVLAGAPSDLTGAIRTLNLRDWSVRTHRLIGHPSCRVCGSPPAASPAPVRLRRRPVTFDADGGHRTTTPSETVRAYRHLMSPLTGIVGALILDTDRRARELGRTCYADDVAAIEPTSITHLRASFRSSSIGKGMTDAQAQASALCEAIEHYSARLHGTELTRSGSWRELRDDAIHPGTVMRFSDHQYRHRAAWNARHRSAFHFVPAPLDPDRRIDWTPIWSLTERRHKLLPTRLLYYDRGERTGDHTVCIGCSNGCASGNTLEEAVLQGFLELVERDAVAIWWYNRLRRPAVDLDSFADRYLSGLVGRYRELDREVVAIDLTTDLGIPVVAAFSHRVGEKEERIAIGYGCHLDARIAVQRALTELCQMLNLDLRGDAAAMDDFGEGWMRWATRADQPYLVPDDAAPARTRDDFPQLRFDDLLDGIAFCRTVVEDRGLEMLVLDQTRTDTAMPVAKVVVPGLRHFWPRFATGRLYDVPVAMGWLPASLAESALNPVPFFF